MSFASILIPLIGGILLIASPQIFTKVTGPALDQAKKRLRGIRIGLICVATIYSLVRVMESGATSGAQAAKADIKMHRIVATNAGDGGWYLAESTYGSFSVQMPIPFNDFTITAGGSNSLVVSTHVVGAQSAEGLKFSATQAPVPFGKPAPDFDGLVKDFAKEGQEVSDVMKIQFMGYPSMTLSASGLTTGGYIR